MPSSDLVNTTGSQPNPTSQTFDCFRCGVCCMKYQVKVGADEARRISRFLARPFDEFEARFADPRWRGRDFLLRQVGGGCVFLDSDGGKLRNCRIQPVKPRACDDWTPGPEKPECRQGLGCDWGLSANSAGQIEGDEEKLRAFQDFLKTLK